MSIADQITRLNNAKAAIKQSIENKGVEVSDSALLDEYPALIDSIEVGSGEGGEGGDPFYEELFNQRTVNGTNFDYLFYQTGLTSLDVSKLDTSNVTSMDNMFAYNYSLIELDVSKFDTSKVTTMRSMFASCYAISELDVSKFDTRNVATMENMFNGCTAVTTLDFSNWDTTNVTSMNNMFSSCYGLQSLDLSSFNTGNVTDMAYMFNYMNNSAMTSLNLSSFDTSNVQYMWSMFGYNHSLQELDIRNFELVHEDGTQAEISGMLEGCDSLRILRLDNCDNATVSKIINEASMPTGQAYINGEYITRKIYGKAEASEGITLPPGWSWEMV